MLCKTQKIKLKNKKLIKEREVIYIDVDSLSSSLSSLNLNTEENMNNFINNNNKITNENIKRKLTNEEKEYICDFLTIDPSKDFETAVCILENIKKEIMDQLKDIEIYPCLINELKNIIETNFHKSKIQPGQMVGVDSATSLGEPTTQMTLNSFHSAGKTCAAVTTGVPRFRELLDTSKQQKHTLITFTLNNEPKDIQDAKRICKSFDEKRIYSLLSYNIPIIINTNNSFENVEELDYKTFNTEENNWYNFFENFISKHHLNYKWCLRLKFNIDVLFEYKFTLKSISKCIENELATCKCVYSPDYIGIIDVYVNTNKVKKDDIISFRKQIDNIKKNDKHKKTFINEENKEFYYIRDILFQYIVNIKISGIDTIEKSYFRKIDSGPDKNKWLFELEGTNYIDVLNKSNVNFKTCMVNNIWEIFNTLGIEAVRRFLIEEFNEIITSGGINVDKVHLELLADSMTCTGNITSVSRYGIGRNETGPLTKASFEQSLDNMLIAAYKYETESITSVSSSIILGQCSKIGSGMMELYNKIIPT
jgi:DNA-directed RNA polymerase II subunit RPB1